MKNVVMNHSRILFHSSPPFYPMWHYAVFD